MSKGLAALEDIASELDNIAVLPEPPDADGWVDYTELTEREQGLLDRIHEIITDAVRRNS